MTLGQALRNIPGDALTYELALLVLAAAFGIYAFVLRTLLGLVGRRPFWLLPLGGSFLLVAAAVLHGFATAVLTPLIGLDPDIYRESMSLRTWSAVCLLGCGTVSLFSGWLYYHQIGDQ